MPRFQISVLLLVVVVSPSGYGITIDSTIFGKLFAQEMENG